MAHFRDMTRDDLSRSHDVEVLGEEIPIAVAVVVVGAHHRGRGCGRAIGGVLGIDGRGRREGWRASGWRRRRRGGSASLSSSRGRRGRRDRVALDLQIVEESVFDVPKAFGVQDGLSGFAVDDGESVEGGFLGRAGQHFVLAAVGIDSVDFCFQDGQAEFFEGGGNLLQEARSVRDGDLESGRSLRDFGAFGSDRRGFGCGVVDASAAASAVLNRDRVVVVQECSVGKSVGESLFQVVFEVPELVGPSDGSLGSSVDDVELVVRHPSVECLADAVANRHVLLLQSI